MQEATTTADGSYAYDDIPSGFTTSLRDLVQKANVYNSKHYRWTINRLKPGSFGFDNLAMCIGHTAEHISGLPSFDAASEDAVEQVAALIHQGWIRNYIFWRDNKPWLKKDGALYYAAAKPLNDARRNQCAVAEYCSLPADEKEKDIVLAKWLIGQIRN
jgi:hypothetical protein